MTSIHPPHITKSCWLQTQRLTLTPFAPSMLEELHQIFIHPLVRQYLMDDKIVELEWVSDTITKSQNLFEQQGYGLWALQEKDRTPLIGFCGYWHFDQLSYPLQLIYGLLPTYWGKGFATEAAQVVIEYGFKKAGFHEIAAAADIPNTASFGVMKQLGMSYWKREESIDYYKICAELTSSVSK